VHQRHVRSDRPELLVQSEPSDQSVHHAKRARHESRASDVSAARPRQR
jgi:hypothetical protein